MDRFNTIIILYDIWHIDGNNDYFSIKKMYRDKQIGFVSYNLTKKKINTVYGSYGEILDRYGLNKYKL